MNIHNIFDAGQAAMPVLSLEGAAGAAVQAHPYSTRRTGSVEQWDQPSASLSDSTGVPSSPKETVFKLVVSEDQSQYARLPLRIRVNKRDESQSIIDTVKAFFGLPDTMGVSFEDSAGSKIVPQYDNFTVKPQEGSEIMVRVILEPDQGIPLPPPSPMADISAVPQSAVSPLKLEDVPKLSPFDNAYGGSDAESVSSSRRDHLASAEISVDNIVEGGRRKRTKFESSALPLFNPPQIPVSGSLSSVSPQRRLTNNGVPSPLPTNQYNFSYGGPLPSPMSHHASDKGMSVSSYNLNGQGQGSAYGSGHGQRLRGRHSGSMSTPRLSGQGVNGAMPTPAPTISSAMSDEDAAYQLIRLGNPNGPELGRTSLSTADDALSGKADASSDDDNDEANGRHRGLKRTASTAGMARTKKKKLPKLQTNIGGIGRDHSDEEDSDSYLDHKLGKLVKPLHSRSNSTHHHKAHGKPKARQMSGTVEAASHIASGRESMASSMNSPVPTGAGDEDLSMLPRCQRCRKSKKGCDRQRPCGRCKDAGIGIEGCVSEDEGNGRKGRFGRHMGVPVKTSMESINFPEQLTPDVGLVEDANGKKRKK